MSVYIEQLFAGIENRTPFLAKSTCVKKIIIDKSEKKISLYLEDTAFDDKRIRACDAFLGEELVGYSVTVARTFPAECFCPDAFDYVVAQTGEQRSLFGICLDRCGLSIDEALIKITVDAGAATVLKKNRFALVFNEKCAEIFSRNFRVELIERTAGEQEEPPEQTTSPEPPTTANQETLY